MIHWLNVEPFLVKPLHVKKNGRRALDTTQSGVGGLLLSSPSPTLRLTPLPSALRAARAHDAVLRMYPGLPLRFIKIHGDILVSYAIIRPVSSYAHPS